MARKTDLIIPKVELFQWNEDNQNFTPLIEDGKINVNIEGNVKEFLFSNDESLDVNEVYTSPSYDVISKAFISGIVSTNQAGTLYIQESDDKIDWFTTRKDNIASSPSDIISSTSYNRAVSFMKRLSLRYVRVIYVNGNIEQESFKLSAYLSN